MINTDSLIGRVIDGYRIESLLGHGGMARVYRAIDENLNRFVAIKIIDPRSVEDNEYRERFKLEARAIAKLNHPNIVSIYRFGEVGELYFMAMEYIEGFDLRWLITDYRRQNEQMPYDTMGKILEQIAKALDYAHKQGVIHRDVKPSNIMISRDGNAILTDFGLALVTSEGTQGLTFGSPHYIAPEQAMSSGGAVSQSDLYSLGVTFYEILAGRVPFTEGSSLQIAMAHLSDPVPDPRKFNDGIHPAFMPVLTKILEKEPEKRYATGALFIRALKAAVAEAKKSPQRTTSSALKLSTAELSQKIKQFRSENPVTGVTESRPVITSSEPETRTEPKRRRWLIPVALVALLAVLAVGAVMVLPQIQNILPAVGGSNVGTSTMALEGVIRDLNGSRLLIYDVPVTLPAADTLPATVSNGDVIRLEGSYHLADDGSIILSALDRIVINGAPVVKAEPTVNQ